MNDVFLLGTIILVKYLRMNNDYILGLSRIQRKDLKQRP